MERHLALGGLGDLDGMPLVKLGKKIGNGGPASSGSEDRRVTSTIPARAQSDFDCDWGCSSRSLLAGPAPASPSPSIQVPSLPRCRFSYLLPGGGSIRFAALREDILIARVGQDCRRSIATSSSRITRGCDAVSGLVRQV